MEKKRYLYKYLPYNQYLFNLLINCEFWMSPPDKLNDPFEGDFRVKDIRKYQKESTINRLLELNKKNFLDDFGFEDNLADALIDINKLSNILYEYINKLIRSKYGITCFSRYKRSVRMWSHYADSHKGVCLIFDEEKLIRDFRKNKNSISIKNVFYSRTLPFIDIIDHDSDEDSFEYIGISNDRTFLFTKLNSWKYENEVRLIKEQDFDVFPNRSVKFNKESLVGVIFGARIQEENKTTILRLLKDEGNDNGLKFYTASKDIESPCLKINKIEKEKKAIH